MSADSAKKTNKDRKKLGEILTERKIISETILQQALGEQKVSGQRLGELLVDRGWVLADEINRALASQMETEVADLGSYVITPEILSLVSEEDARRFNIMPLFKTNDIFYVAMVNPNDVFAIDHLQQQTGLKIKSLLAIAVDLSWAIEQYYKSEETVEDLLAIINQEDLIRGEKEQEVNIVKLVNILISKAVHSRASDIHIEPEDKIVSVRYRVDGVLRKEHVLPKSLQTAVISRIKILANLDISERRLPQDGRVRLKIESKNIDFRVSTCATVYGENLVLRVLDKTGLVLGLPSLGIGDDDLKKFKKMLSASYGIVLVTGPTGSGKTTTLYSALQVLNKEDVNIMTVEDPVEYQFHGMRQVQVNTKIGLDFAKALRSFLRQDPDIIMVGEIRDLETAEIATQAALTGHLVFSTLHTNDAPTSFTRLVEMGIAPFLVSSSILGVVAQRLIRKVCPVCKFECKLTSEVMAAMSLDESKFSDVVFYKAKGCKKCNNTGYKGRLGIFEVLYNTPKIQELILNGSSNIQIQKIAQAEGMTTLRQAALDSAVAGITTLDEVVRLTRNVDID